MSFEDCAWLLLVAGCLILLLLWANYADARDARVIVDLDDRILDYLKDGRSRTIGEIVEHLSLSDYQRIDAAKVLARACVDGKIFRTRMGGVYLYWLPGHRGVA